MRSIGSAVKRLSNLADRLVPSKPGITVLIYHRVGGGTSSSVDLPVDEFERQLEYLAGSHRVLTLDHAVAELSNGAAEPGVVVTFDDGTTDFVEHAVPALVRHGVPATLFVATQFVDEQTPFPWGAPPVSWRSLAAAMATDRVAVGSHSHAHLLMDRLPAHVAADDLRRSVFLIEDHLDVTPRHFAYPKAVPAADGTAEVVRSMFDTAAIARGGTNRNGRFDPYRVRRVSIQRGDSPEVFAVKAAGGARLEGLARDLAARIRYRNQTQ